MNLSLKEDLHAAIREIVIDTERKNKDKLRALIEKTDCSLEELQVVVPSFLPQFSSTSKLTLSSHARFCNCIVKVFTLKIMQIALTRMLLLNHFAS